MSYHFRNLVFEGGGVRGIAYTGAIEVLEQKGILQEIVRVAGTSAGSIIALLIGLNYSNDEIKRILNNIDLKKFLDSSWGFILDTRRLFTKYGWYKGDHLRNWAGNIIKEKTGDTETTFRELYRKKKRNNFKDIYVIGTNLSTHLEEVFSHEHTPNMCIADAIRISVSIPLFFAAIKNKEGDIYVDGGVLDNYPIKLFDREKYIEKYYFVPEYYHSCNKRLEKEKNQNPINSYVYNKETLGFRLASSREIDVFHGDSKKDKYQIVDLLSYTRNLLWTFMNLQDNQHLHSDDWQRTVYINNLGVRATEFDIDESKKEELVNSGKKYTEKYFMWFDNPECTPVNRPSLL